MPLKSLKFTMQTTVPATPCDFCDLREAIEFFDAALEAKAEWSKKKDATTGDTALHMAARSDNIDIVKLLCEKYKALIFLCLNDTNIVSRQGPVMKFPQAVLRVEVNKEDARRRLCSMMLILVQQMRQSCCSAW